jgi:hypothetical protein
MAKVLRVTLSMEWQCEQLACANALPAMTLGSALHGIAAANMLKAITTGDVTRCMWILSKIEGLVRSCNPCRPGGRLRQHPVRRHKIFSRISNKLRIAWMIDRLHSCDDFRQLGVMKTDVLDQFGLRIRRSGDKNRAGASN